MSEHHNGAGRPEGPWHRQGRLLYTLWLAPNGYQADAPSNRLTIRVEFDRRADGAEHDAEILTNHLQAWLSEAPPPLERVDDEAVARVGYVFDPPFGARGIGLALLNAATAYVDGSDQIDGYVFSTEGADHEPTEFEREIMVDMLNGLFSYGPFWAPLSEAFTLARRAQAAPVAADDEAVERDTGPATTVREAALIFDRDAALLRAETAEADRDRYKAGKEAMAGALRDIATQSRWPSGAKRNDLAALLLQIERIARRQAFADHAAQPGEAG